MRLSVRRPPRTCRSRRWAVCPVSPPGPWPCREKGWQNGWANDSLGGNHGFLIQSSKCHKQEKNPIEAIVRNSPRQAALSYVVEDVDKALGLDKALLELRKPQRPKQLSGQLFKIQDLGCFIGNPCYPYMFRRTQPQPQKLQKSKNLRLELLRSQTGHRKSGR